MAEFKFAGQRYNTEDLSESQSELTKSLSFTKNLVKEIEEKLEQLRRIKISLEIVWDNELGSKIVEHRNLKSGTQIKLENGKKLNSSQLSKNAANCLKKLLFVNEQISYHNNQLQVLDTAHMSYSKSFYKRFKVTE